MRLIYFFIFLFFLGSTKLTAQNKQLVYGFEEIPQSLLVNPGDNNNFSWYSSIPFLGGISFQAGYSGATASDLFGNDGLSYNNQFRDKVINEMTIKDELSGTYQIDLINIGFRSKKNPDLFYSFGAYNEGDAIGYYFQDYAVLAYEGNANNLNKKFDLSDLKTRGEILNVYHFGINKKVSNQLSVGVRAKLYSSFINFTSTKNKGYFLTTEGQNNLLRTTLDADIEIKTSGIFELKDVIDDEAIDNVSGISKILGKRALLGGDLGFGFDLGFSYNIDERTYFTGSLLDVGFIYHTNDTRTYSLKGTASTEGLEIFLPADSNNTDDQWRNLVDELKALVPYTVTSENYLTFRPTKLNASLRRDFGKQIGSKVVDCNCTSAAGGNNNGKIYKNSFGAHFYAINRPRGPQTALTAFYQHRLGNFMTLKSTYTVDKFSFTNFGLGTSIQAGPVNFYILADNLLGYRNLADTHYTSVQFGLNIISWGKK